MIETLAIAAVLMFFVGMGVSVAPATLNRSNRSNGGGGFRRNGALAFPTSPPASAQQAACDALMLPRAGTRTAKRRFGKQEL